MNLSYAQNHGFEYPLLSINESLANLADSLQKGHHPGITITINDGTKDGILIYVTITKIEYKFNSILMLGFLRRDHKIRGIMHHRETDFELMFYNSLSKRKKSFIKIKTFISQVHNLFH